jgi:acyl-CoA synthetase (AMP-forming)/AMP-acid ligase II
VISIFGILKAGGVFVVVNPQVKASKLQYILEDCQARVLVTDSRHFEDVSDTLVGRRTVERVILTDYVDGAGDGSGSSQGRVQSYQLMLNEYPSTRSDVGCIDIDLASLIYTSGSTGRPKGVMLTHLNMVSAATSIVEYLENTSDDVIHSVLPLSFDYGLYQILMAFKFGGSVVLERSFAYPYQTIDIIMRERVTGLPIVPTIAAILLKLRNLEKYDLSSLRYITNTAQALPVKHITGLQEVFPKAKIYSMYGLTECKRVSYLPPEEINRIPTSVGRAMPNTEAYIVDEKGRRL